MIPTGVQQFFLGGRWARRKESGKRKLTQAGQSKETSLAPEINEASDVAAAALHPKTERSDTIGELSPLHARCVPHAAGDRCE
jgi:hypothetical protein